MCEQSATIDGILFTHRHNPPAKRHAPLRAQGPEGSSGSFDPEGLCLSFRSPPAYSLPSTSDSAGSGQASRVPFAGRAHDQLMFDDVPTHHDRRIAAEAATVAAENHKTADVCTPPGAPRVHTFGIRNAELKSSIRRLDGGSVWCAGCAGSRYTYRVRDVCAHTHAPHRLGWAPHTPHTPHRGYENGAVAPSRGRSRRKTCAPPGVHTDPPGCAHVNGLTAFGGGADA